MIEYFDNPFKDKHSHLSYGDINGPPDRSLHIYLPIIQELTIAPIIAVLLLHYCFWSMFDDLNK